VLRAARSSAGTRRVERNARALDTLQTTQASTYAPRLLAKYAGSDGILISVETCMAGKPLLHVRSGQVRDTLMLLAAESLARMQQPLLKRRELPAEVYDSLLGSAFEYAMGHATAEDAGRLGRLDAFMREHMIGRRWTTAPCHGDFKIGNIMVQGRTGIAGFIDWDCWEPEGFPLIDLMALCVYEDSRERGGNLSASVIDGLFEEHWRPLFGGLLAGHAHRLQVDPLELDMLKAAFLLVNLRDRVHWMGLAHYRYSRLFLSDPLVWICKRFGL
jgi:Ser/Thr protein kinase RdoA (MazF antagonist)